VDFGVRDNSARTFSASNSPSAFCTLHSALRIGTALVKEAEAKEFWSIPPATVKSKIAKLPDQAAAVA